MDAVKFVKEYLRMCTKVDECEDCPVCKTDFCTVPAKERSQESAEEIVKLVEEWSAAHPRKTRQSVFLEQWPEASIGDDGVLRLCPFLIDASYRNNDGSCKAVQRQCSDCRKEFWAQELDGCKYCKEYEDLPEHFVSSKPVGRVFDTCIQTDENGRWHLEVPSGADIGIKFCPMCGRKLPQPPKGE